MAFERFTKTRANKDEGLFIKITEDWRVVFSKALLKDTEYPYIYFACYFDREKRIVGFQPWKTPRKFTYKLSNTNGLSCRAFISMLKGINLELQIRYYKATWDKDHKMFVIDLKG